MTAGNNKKMRLSNGFVEDSLFTSGREKHTHLSVNNYLPWRLSVFEHLSRFKYSDLGFCIGDLAIHYHIE